MAIVNERIMAVVRRHNNSLRITIPFNIAEANNIKPGDRVFLNIESVEFNKENQKIGLKE